MAWGAELLAIDGVARQPGENPFGGVRERRRDAVAAEASRERQRRPQAMIGIMGFCAASKVPGSVPGLQFITPYAGEPMGPFSEVDVALPMVTGMHGLFKQ